MSYNYCIIIGEKDTTSLTTASGMFANTPNLTEIDLSGVDVSKLDVDMMFTNTGATVGWAKDATNASILNRSYQKPSTLTFKVKE